MEADSAKDVCLYVLMNYMCSQLGARNILCFCCAGALPYLAASLRSDRISIARVVWMKWKYEVKSRCCAVSIVDTHALNIRLSANVYRIFAGQRTNKDRDE